MAGVCDELLLLFHTCQDGTDHLPGKRDNKQKNHKPAYKGNGRGNAQGHHTHPKLAGYIHKENQTVCPGLLYFIFVPFNLARGTGNLPGILGCLLRADR